MPGLLLAAASAAFAAPGMTSDMARKIQQSYPPDALRNNWSAAALVEIQADPEGKIGNCSTLSTFGKKELADGVCGIIKRFTVRPASIDGAPAHGVFRTIVSFWIPSDSLGKQIGAMHQPADLEFEVNTLPDGKATLRVPVDLLVNTSGKVQSCAGVKDDQSQYAKVACQQVSGMSFATLRDNNDQPVDYVRGVSVEFRLSPTTGSSSSPAKSN